ncbi:Intraflagellar transport protein 74 like protein [Aduncisulcus paluster]|uniref:Intraflagellar transport protein 74 like protein n=1 Tax=Aduncisulcus paluster TaxID=2918883 RepID=A0ABQ5KI96_9EUKA|nr:Intraflagellar transport protein 74 like protein [Aduncisulcus paluster]
MSSERLATSSRPLTSMRAPASRMGTQKTRMGTRAGRPESRGFVRQQAVGTAVTTDVKIRTRLMTPHGYTGPKVVTGGRQVYNADFFRGELRKRISEVREEIVKVEEEAVEVAEDREKAARLTSRRKIVQQEVEDLKKRLIELNSLKERCQHGQISLTVLKKDVESVHGRAAELSKTVNETSLKRMELERKNALKRGEVEAARKKLVGLVADALSEEGAEQFSKTHMELTHLRQSESKIRGMLAQVKGAVDVIRRRSRFSPELSNMITQIDSLHKLDLQTHNARQTLEQVRDKRKQEEASAQKEKEKQHASGDGLNTMPSHPSMVQWREEDEETKRKRLLAQKSRLEEEISSIRQDISHTESSIMKRRRVLEKQQRSSSDDSSSTLTPQQKKIVETFKKIQLYLKKYEVDLPKKVTALAASADKIASKLQAITAEREESETQSHSQAERVDEQIRRLTDELDNINGLEEKVGRELEALHDRCMSSKKEIELIREEREISTMAARASDGSTLPEAELQEKAITFSSRKSELAQDLSTHQGELSRIEVEIEKSQGVARVEALTDRLARMERKIREHVVAIDERRAAADYALMKKESLDILEQLEENIVSPTDLF